MSAPYRTAALAKIAAAPRCPDLRTRVGCFFGRHGRAIGRLHRTSFCDIVPMCEHCGRFVLVGKIVRGEVWFGGGARLDFDDRAREWLRGHDTFEMLVTPATPYSRAFSVTVQTPDDVRTGEQV